MTKQSFFILLILLFGCQKTKFETRPRLKLVSLSSVNVKHLSALQIILQITDKQGDFIDTVWMTKITNGCPDSDLRTNFLLPSDVQRTNNFLGEYIFSLDYRKVLQPLCNKRDTAVFRFWTKDKKGNFSDTVKTSPIFIDFQ
jgi:hypothetical protein